ncbi:B12-binding domain-containing radical SAM protein [Candidatus Pacearchaeota archaeon]|nr:B12-binding domain-containing radical SAM protein [Candidatus Pacearchaeota archaeon]
MKITLISTSTFPSDQGIRTISAVLKRESHEVKIIFMTLGEDYSRNYYEKELLQLERLCTGSDLIGINAFASTSERAKKIIKFLKSKIPIPIIYGGVHPTLFPEKCIEFADMVCVGEGEEAIIELVNALEKGKSISEIKNIWSKEKRGKIITNTVRNLLDEIDKLPLPDYDLEDHYILKNQSIRKFKESDLVGQVLFLTGRGCPYGCDYCSNSCFNELYKGKRKKILRLHSPKYIIEGILYFKKKFKTLGYFDIRDDTFSMRPLENIKEFCKLYKERVNMRFKCLGDPHTIDDEKIKLLVDTGCTDIIIGIQGSEKTNKEIYHRNQTDSDVLRSAKILHKYKDKLAVMYDIIACNPYDKPEYILDLIDLVRKIPKPYFLSVNNLVFFPGSALYNRAKRDGLIKTEKDAAYQLNYWDRAKHIKLKGNNVYLNLILNLMRGAAKENRIGFLPNFLMDWALKPERVKYHLKHPAFSYLVLSIIEIYDNLRERILKPIFRALPLSFKIWHDKVRYHFK